MRALTTLFLTTLAVATFADNVALTAGGHPRMMKGHPQVSMASEAVNLVVHAKTVETEATFVFHNDGPACRVRMGFPDFGLWAYAYPRKKAKSMFKRYRSYVAGKPVATKLVLGGAPGEQWQTKEVAFPAHASVTVRESYTTEVGGIAAKVMMGTAAYLVHTGASWKGPIGKATIHVRFAPDTELPEPFQALTVAPKSLQNETLISQVSKPGGLLVFGPGQPSVAGRTLTFVKTNWTPKADEDVYVFYRYSPKALQVTRAKSKP